MENTQNPNQAQPQSQTPAQTGQSAQPAACAGASAGSNAASPATTVGASTTPAAPAQAAAPATAPVSPAPATTPTAAPAAAQSIPSSGPVPDVKKTYYKTFSPRLLGIAFSYAIDKDRAKMGAKSKGYTVPENPLVLETGNMFWGELMVEVQNASAQDSNVVDLTQKEVAVGGSLNELESKAGKKAVKTYSLHQGTETKTVAIF